MSHVQGELPKLEIAARFRVQDNAVLFATRVISLRASASTATRCAWSSWIRVPFGGADANLARQWKPARCSVRTVAGIHRRKLEMYPFDALRARAWSSN